MALPNLIVEDDQISGVADDGSANGILKARILQNELTKIPASTLGSGSYVVNASGQSAVFLSYIYALNVDGSNSGLVNKNGSGPFTDVAFSQFLVYGKTVGVRFLINSTTPVFSVIIDGVPYGVNPYFFNARLLNIVSNTSPGGFNNFQADYIVADNLTDSCHSVQIGLINPGSTSQSLIIYGVLCEKKYYPYSATPLDVILNGTVSAVLASPAYILPSLSGAAGIVRGMKTITYYNADSTSHTFYIKYNNGTTNYILWNSGVVAAGGTATYNFSNIGLSAGDSGGTITCTHYLDAAPTTTAPQFSITCNKI